MGAESYLDTEEGIKALIYRGGVRNAELSIDRGRRAGRDYEKNISAVKGLARAWMGHLVQKYGSLLKALEANPHIKNELAAFERERSRAIKVRGEVQKLLLRGNIPPWKRR